MPLVAHDMHRQHVNGPKFMLNDGFRLHSVKFALRVPYNFSRKHIQRPLFQETVKQSDAALRKNLLKAYFPSRYSPLKSKNCLTYEKIDFLVENNHESDREK